MPSAIIAEDEPLLRAQFVKRLREAWPELQLLAQASNGAEALRAIRTHRPSVAFLDIQMPEMTGLEVAREANGQCHIVFVTAYDQFAVAAFEHQAVDYLLKPLSPPRLAETVARLKARLHAAPPDLDALIERLQTTLTPTTKEYVRWITASHGAALKMIAVEDIYYFQSDEKYTRVVSGDSETLIRKPIKELVEELDPKLFWQIHRATLVNVNHIANIARDFRGNAEVRLKNRPEKLTVSRAFAHLFRQM
jgi:DNA-binding LytR/AlgR family response regulator